MVTVENRTTARSGKKEQEHPLSIDIVDRKGSHSHQIFWRGKPVKYPVTVK
jgi:hypothetical protein